MVFRRMNTRLSLAVLLLSVVFCMGQAPESAPSPDERKTPAHVRVWSMLFDESSPVSIKIKTTEPEPTNLLEAPGKGATRGFYAEVPKGAGEITASAAGVVLASAKLDLVPGDYRTILISRQNGKIDLQILQDPLPGQKDFPPAVRLLNFGTGRSAEVTLGGQTKITVPDNKLVITPISAKADLTVQVVLPDPAGGPPAISSTDVDLRTSPSWSMVVTPDYRGKLRPRVSPDGRE